MAESPVQGNRPQGPSPETSLTWCLSHLSKPVSTSEDQSERTVDTDTCSSGKIDKRGRESQWRALVAIRTQHIKSGSSGIARFRVRGGLKLILDLLKYPECSRKVLDLALSILANCCTELETRVEVRKLGGITVVVDILKRNVAIETVQNRAARALGNLAMDPESSVLIHSAGAVSLLLLCVQLSSASSSPTAAPAKTPCPKMECAQSAARALLYLADTPSNRLSLLSQGTLTALAPLIGPEYPLGLRRAALKTIHELTRGCTVECAKEVSRSGVLAQLGLMASGESGKPYEELALKALANMCSQGCLRPLVGSLGVIQKFTEEVKQDPLKSGGFLKALCLLCKEAVNRAKVKESGGLEVLIGFLAAHQSHPLSRLAILACVDFVYDESALEQLQELGLVPLLIARLVELAKGEEPSSEKMDMSVTSNMFAPDLVTSSCFDSFDFPQPEGNRKEEVGKEQGPGSSSFLSLRSWLVSEGLISSEGELLDSPGGSEGEWGTLQIPPSSSPQPPSPCPDSLSCPSPSHSSPSNPRIIPQPASMSSPTQTQLSSPSKTTALSTSTPQSSSTPTPDMQLHSPSSLSSPTKMPQVPVSSSKFSSPQRKRPRIHPAARLAKITLDTPPSVPRQSPYHPYHPEPWAPESPILLLLSRFSHTTDPSAALVNSGIVSGLLFYLTHHQDPSSRCFRILCRLSCNPSCLQALVRTGSVALIRHHLCQREGLLESGERQTDRVKAKVKQLGLALLNNLRVQCESWFGSGVLTHVMLSGSESDKLNCALSLPLINSNKALLKKLLLDNGGLLLALQPLGCDEDDDEEDRISDCPKLLSDWFNTPPQIVPAPRIQSLYFSLLIGCLSSLTDGLKTELDKNRLRTLNQVRTLSFHQKDQGSPPPLKKPCLASPCPYHDSTFDLVFLLDDGTQVLANRDAVAGTEGTDGVGSEYFRALLWGGFGEAQASTGKTISIKDVSKGMLVPVMHYLHGCCLTKDTAKTSERSGEAEVGGQCQFLESLALEGLRICQGETEGHSVERQAFQKTPFGEMMVGASRFLVTELQREAEDLLVSLLLSCSTKTASPSASTLTEDKGENVPSNVELEGPEGESADECLANRTSGLELSSLEAKGDSGLGQMEKQQDPGCGSPCQTDTKQQPSGPVRKVSKALRTASPLKTTPVVSRVSRTSCTPTSDKALHPQESRLTSKSSVKPSSQQVLDFDMKSAAKDSSSCPRLAPGGWVPSALLPQVYWFSQRHSYPGLGKACLSLLLGSQVSPRLSPPSSSSAGECLRRLAREADCTETLKRDLLSLVATALS